MLALQFAGAVTVEALYVEAIKDRPHDDSPTELKTHPSLTEGKENHLPGRAIQLEIKQVGEEVESRDSPDDGQRSLEDGQRNVDEGEHGDSCWRRLERGSY